jgi:Bardet-Biedl syndrome 5 protein
VVWFANLASNFNVSLPYMQVKSYRVRESKFGETLVLETFAKSGGYVLGFRIDPHEKLEAVLKEIKSFHNLFSKSPIFGVEFTVEAEVEAPQVMWPL